MEKRNDTLFQEALTIPGGVSSPVRAFRAVGGTPKFFRKAWGTRFEDKEGRRYVEQGTRAFRGHPGGLDVQLLHGQDRSLRCGNEQLQFRVDRLLPEAVAACRGEAVGQASRPVR